MELPKQVNKLLTSTDTCGNLFVRKVNAFYAVYTVHLLNISCVFTDYA